MSAADARPASRPEANGSQDLAKTDSSGPAASASYDKGKHVAADGSQEGGRTVKKSTKICRYFQTKSGCRAGDACRYQHDSLPNSSHTTKANETSTRKLQEFSSGAAPEPRNDGSNKGKDTITKRPTNVVKRSPVKKPVPQSQQTNPRDFQIGQVVRRFRPAREDVASGATVLTLSLIPSDPDFPFELEKLECRLTVPIDWPSGQGKPILTVHNTDIPKGYQINIERGFDTLTSSDKTLLTLLNDLDRNLERFLSSEKAQTIKIVANRKKIDPPRQEAIVVPKVSSNKISTPSQPIWSSEQKSNAKAKRESDVRQLEARMGRLPLFSVSSDKMLFTIPIQYAKPGRLPVALQPLKEIVLCVPLLYDLEPCSIKLKGVSGSEADNVEMAFQRHVADNHESTLMAHINYLTQHLHEMAVTPKSEIDNTVAEPQKIDIQPQEQHLKDDDHDDGVPDEDRPHLIFLSQPPPEWSRNGNGEDDASQSSSEELTSEGEEEVNSSADEAHEGGASIPPPTSISNPEKGVLFSLPQLELTGIELLEVHNLSLVVKCDRCKSPFEFRNIKPISSTSDTNVTRTETCNKCASPMNASYRSEMVHANSIKAGFLDMDGCTVQDMLPSTFLPTCSDCSTTQPLPGTTAVRGDTSLIVCRTCHRKMTMHIHEVKFLRVSTNDSRLTRPLAPKRRKENLGITSGTELPSRGRCKHYAKSFRWFRFSCCNRVYPCDRCHDEAESHPNEHANRMICGWCSREQNYRPEDCHFCQRSVIRKTGGGFWEGGKGTRDRVKMNRNDPRKYKRIGGTTAGEKKK